MKILHLFILLLFAFVLAQKDNYVLDYDLDEGFVLETLNQIDEENSLNTSPVSNEETENSEETKVQQILPIITPQKIYQEAIKVPTKYVPTGPMTFKDSSNQPIMFNISNLDWVSICLFSYFLGNYNNNLCFNHNLWFYHWIIKLCFCFLFTYCKSSIRKRTRRTRT